MPTDDSLAEYERAFWADVGEHEPALRRFVAARRTKPAGEPEDPREIVEREITVAFRAGVSRYIRKALWHFLEQERKARGLTQDDVAKNAGISQPAYSKIKTGATSFDAILLVFRALGVELRGVPSPSVVEQTAEGLLAALDFAQHEVLGRDHRTFKPRREDLEWLRHLQCCRPWLEAYAAGDEQKGVVVSDCIAAAISLRLGRAVKAPPFAQLAGFWEHWLTAWEFCASAIWIEDRP